MASQPNVTSFSAQNHDVRKRLIRTQSMPPTKNASANVTKSPPTGRKSLQQSTLKDPVDSDTVTNDSEESHHSVQEPREPEQMTNSQLKEACRVLFLNC